MARSAKRKPTPFARVRARALALPEAWEDFPWGETVAKVGKKVFVFLGPSDEQSGDESLLTISVKLRESHEEALALAGSAPTGYGLGRAGWVTLKVVRPSDEVVELAGDWVEESYRLVAPKKLVKVLDEDAGSDR